MGNNTLHLHLPSEERPSVLPWIVVAATILILLVLIARLLESIPASLQQEASKALASTSNASEYSDIAITADGRQLQLSGSMDINHSLQPLTEQLSAIKGVQGISQNVTLIDPALQLRLAEEQFGLALARIDTSVVAFQAGSVSFTAESDTALTQLLALLRQFPSARIRIEGHTDNTGSDTVNLRVSQDRARAVANYLMARGIASDRLIAAGYGSTQPIADNSIESGRTRNRRIEISQIN